MHNLVRLRITAIILLFILFMFLIFSFIIHKVHSGLIISLMGEQAQVCAVTASFIVTAHMDEYLRIRNRTDENNTFYRATKKVFENIRNDKTIKFIYTERQVSEDQIEYILDSEPSGASNASPIGSTESINRLRRKAYAERVPLHGGLVHDPLWGPVITGYAPLFDPQTGNFEGLVGVDIDAKMVYLMMRRMALLFGIGIVLLTTLAAFPVYRLSSLIARQSSIDPPTGFRAEKRFMPELERSIERAKRGGPEPVLLVACIDGFDKLIDSYGHAASEAVALSISKAIRTNLPRRARVYRMGPGRFALLPPWADKKRTLDFAASILKEMNACVEADEGDDRPRLPGLSMGVAIWKQGQSATAFYENADDAMYASQRFGGCRATDYDEFRNKDGGAKPTA